MSPPRIRHCRLPHPQSTPEQTREKTPLIRSRAKLRLSMLIKPSFHQRSRNTKRLCAPCSAPSATKPARRSVPRADVATGRAEGNRSLTPVRAPSHRSVHHPPPWRRVAHLPSDSLKSHCFFFFYTIFDEYANILKGMYSIRFNGRSDLGVTSTRPDTGRSDHGEAPARLARDPMPPLINSLTAWQPNKFRKRKERGSKEKEI